MIEIALRRLPPDTSPQPGEVLVLSAQAAQAALDQGADAFARSGTPARIVVRDNPTLDDMLAASIVQWKLAGESLPPRMADYARYAGIAREGLRPGKGALEDSLEGLFLAIRNARDPDLTKPEAGAAFVRDWQRLAQHIKAAALADKDPFNADAPTSEFARERAFLATDQQVYFQDVQRGSQWIVQIPGGPPRSSALVLRQPKSLLWKFWARQDASAPTGDCFLLLGVEFAAGDWTFSVDPVQRLSLQGLAEAFQTAELAANPAAKENPWFDGARFAYSLISAPRGGTKLPAPAVMDVLRQWANARKPQTQAAGGLGKGLVAAAVVVALLACVGVVVVLATRKDDPPLLAANSAEKVVDFRSRGVVLSSRQLQDLRSEGVDIDGFALIVGVGKSSFGALPAACRDAGLLYGILTSRFGYKPENVRLLVDDPDRALDLQGNVVPNYGVPTRENVSRAMTELSEQTRRYQKGDRTNFVFYYAGHGETVERADAIGYLVLSGFHENRDKKLPDLYGYNMGHLAKDVRQNIRSSHQLLLIDCCFSGFVTRARGNPRENPSSVYELWKERAHVVITAGTADQLAYEEGDHSVFSETLFRGLGKDAQGMPADANQDGILTDGELANWLGSEVPKAFGSSSRTQTPQTYRGLEGLDDVGQFLFLKK